MRAGQLRHRVTVLTPVLTDQPNGEKVTTWRPDRRLWADVRPLKREETEEAARVVVAGEYEIYLRYNPSVTHAQRVEWRFAGQCLVMEIAGVNHDPRRTWTRLECREATTED